MEEKNPLRVLNYKDKPSLCYEMGCPLATTGKGFVLGTGDPEKAKIGLVLEAPSNEDLQFSLTPPAFPNRKFLPTRAAVEGEIARRKKAYPKVEEKFLRRGAPLMGKNGIELDMWVLPTATLKRDDLYIDHVLRCLPPKGKKGYYPTGDDRKEAEKCCRVYDRFVQMKPDTALISLHPASILKEVTPLPLQIKDFEKARDFVKQGRKVLMLLGGKAAHAFLRYGENVTKWRGAYQVLKEKWHETYKEMFEYKSKGKKREIKKQQSMDEALFEMGGAKLPKPKKTRKKKDVSNA